MEDNVEISSTTPHVGEPDFLDDRMAEPSSDFGGIRFEDREALTKFEDILDLAGGAKEAIARHRQSDPAMTHDFSASGSPGPVEVPKDTLPSAGQGFSDSLGERTPFEGFGGAALEPETSPVSPATTGKEPPPSLIPKDWNIDKRDEPIFPSSAPSQPLMHSSAAGRAEPLGQEGDPSRLGSVVFPSSISPLHSPDSLEELSLSESPNQAPMSMPFGSYAAPVTDFAQKPSQDVPLNEDMDIFECKAESEVSLGSLDRSIISKQEGETVKVATLPTVESDRLLSSFITSEMDLGSKLDTGKSARCEDSGVASSPDEKLGSSVGSHDDVKIDSDKEGLVKDSESGESTGSTPTQSPVNPKITAESFLIHAPFNPTANMDVPHYDTEDVTKAMDETAKDILSSKTSLYESDPITSKVEVDDDDDDFMFEMKASAASKNPFQGFSPIGDSSSGFPQFGETASDRKASKVSESPTPDLVQHAHDGDLQDPVQTKPKEEATVDLVQMASDSVMETVSSSVHSALPEKSEESSVPPSLPDILKSSPLNPDKMDSGSSEESSDYEHSPTQEVKMEDLSTTNPFAFDTKISLLKEMVEETEARAAENLKPDVEEPSAEKTFGAFDLLKEAENTTKNKDSGPEEKDLMFTGQDSPKFLESSETRNPPMAMDLPTTPPTKPVTAEESDSESPVTDSLSPVLEAMAKNPASFQVEVGSKSVEDSKTSPVKVIKGLSEGGAYLEEHETSEQEVSSEEFEFIERPPKGVMDEFLENLDSSRFAKAPEIGTDDDASPGFGQAELPADVGSELGSRQNSYTLLTQPDVEALPPKLKMDLENPVALSKEVVHHVHETAVPSPTPVVQSNTEEPEKATPSQKKEEDQGANVTTHSEGLKAAQLTTLSTETVVDLLYWRDVKTTGVVFGASLFLLLSLTVCSIISVFSYVALALLSVTITFRIYKGILQAVQKSDEGHPFKLYLDQDLAVSEDLVHKYSDTVLVYVNNTLKELRRLFLVEDLVDSLKFAVLMWILTYVGALFNGLTLLILGLIALFSCPVIYERHQKQIDHYLALARNQMKDIVGKIQAKIPGMKPKAE